MRRRLPRAATEALLRRGTTLRAMLPAEKARMLRGFAQSIHPEIPAVPALPARGLAILAPRVPRQQAENWRIDPSRPRLGFEADSTTRTVLHRLAVGLALGRRDR